MRKILLSLSLFVSAMSFAQVGCCNVVDGAGLTVVDTNGACITAPNLPSYNADDCFKEKVAKAKPKKVVTKPKKVVLLDSEKTVLLQALEGVKFKTNSDYLLPASLPKIDAVAEIMNNHPDYKLTIDGYTDNTGKSAYNHELSLKRANAVKARLITDGIAGSRITTHGYGEERPVATNDTVEGRAKNRRVEFLVSY